MKLRTKLIWLAAVATLCDSAFAATATVEDSAPSGGTSIDFGSSIISPPASVTFGNATFSGGAFLPADPGVYSGTAATPPGASEFWSIGISGANGTIDSGGYTFSQGVSSLSFEWGSPDAYNTITFYDQGGHSLGSFTGTYVDSFIPPFSLGDQSVTRYFTFSSPTDPIYSAFLTSPTNAFETANYSYVSAVPEATPSTMFLAGLGMFGFVMLVRRRQAGSGPFGPSRGLFIGAGS